MRFRFLVPLLALVLAACDTGGPATDSLSADDFIGEWTVALSEETVSVTVTAAQEVPDLSLPATSTFQVSGAHDRSVDHVSEFLYEPVGPASNDPILARLIANDVPFLNTDWETSVRIRDNDVPGAFRIEVAIRDLANQTDDLYQATLNSTEAISFDRLGVTLDGVAVPPQQGGGDGVVLDGRFAFAARSVGAGETLTQAAGPAALVDHADMVAFDADGSYRLLEGGDERTGAWEIVGEGVRLLHGTGEIVFDVDRSGDGLRLTHEGAPSYGLTSSFIPLHERLYLEDGTASDVRGTSVVQLTR